MSGARRERGRMHTGARRAAALVAGVLAALAALSAAAQPVTPELAAVRLGRTQGFFTPQEVELRAGVFRAAGSGGKALLVFRGWPGIANLEQAGDAWRSLNFMRTQLGQFLDAGIAVVVVDCPTDQRALRDRGNPMACDDDYRASARHADDVRRLLAHLRAAYGVTEPYLFGHSYGTISSKWLAVNLGEGIAGSIHSAAQTRAGGGPYARFGYTAASVDLARARAPVLHVHHGRDQCPYTPYATVVSYAAPGSLVTVRGGLTNGDPCGGTHHHSYEGRERAATEAIVRWILAREVAEFAGEE